MGVNSQEIRRKRQDLTALAKPQMGVDALKGRFGRAARDIAGVTEKQPSGAAAR
jgi:hypothetical protein